MTGARLAHPGLVCDIAIGQSTTVTQRVFAHLFYRGLVFHRAPSIGDTLRTSVEVVGLRRNRPRAGRPPTGLAVLRLSGVKDYERAERLGAEYAADLRLLADIGWSPREAGESFTLTMPADELASLTRRLQQEADQLLAGDSNLPLRRQDETTTLRFAAGLEACEAILAGLSSAALPPEAVRDLAPIPISGEQREVLRDLMTHRLFGLS